MIASIVLTRAQPLSQQRLHIVSSNNFPTAAGLVRTPCISLERRRSRGRQASSASGYAALAFTLSKLFDLPISASDLSRIARQGSGSACRSIFGGYVAWEAGTLEDGSDSRAVQIADVVHWPNMEALICVVSADKKAVASTAGMQRTVETSSLLQHRIKHVVPKRMETLTKAIKDKDFPTFAEETMADSNSFHACCLDTSPPIFYLNDTSKAIIAVIVELNRSFGETIAAYTFDAGPNAVIYTLAEHLPLVAKAIQTYFPPAQRFNDVKGLLRKVEGVELPSGWNDKVIPSVAEGAVKAWIHTGVGDGPRVLNEASSLVNSSGMPKHALE